MDIGNVMSFINALIFLETNLLASSQRLHSFLYHARIHFSTSTIFERLSQNKWQTGKLILIELSLKKGGKN